MESISEKEDGRCLLCLSPTTDPIGVCVACRDEGVHFTYPEANRMTQLQIYYDILNENAAFLAELQELDRAIEELLSEPVMLQVAFWEDVIATSSEAALSSSKSLLQEFVKKWSLPTDRGLTDVWDSIILARESGIALSLRVAHWSAIGAVVEGTIRPFCPPDFWYEPTREGTQWVAKYAAAMGKRVEQSILSQARALEKQAEEAGYKRLSPRYRKPGEMRDLALRLYRKVVLKYDWPDLVYAENPDLWLPDGRREAVETSAVQQSTRKWAEDLCIPLRDQ